MGAPSLTPPAVTKTLYSSPHPLTTAYAPEEAVPSSE